MKTLLLSGAATAALALTAAAAQDVPLQDAVSPEKVDVIAAGEDGMVVVTIDGVEANGGDVYVALQTRDGFAQVGGEYAQTATADASSIDVTFEGVAPGEYAVAVFQDADGDGSVTLGETGPTEPWGFSGDVSGVPSFEGAMMMVEGDTNASVSLSGGETAIAAMPSDDDAASADEYFGADRAERAASVDAPAAATETYDPSFGSDDADLPAATGPVAAADTELSADDLNTQQMQRSTALPLGETIASNGEGRVVVTVTGVEPDGGDVFVALQDEDGFAAAAGQYAQTRTADGDSVEVIFDSVANGEYAVAVFQDTNEDDTLTLGEAGPTEPWGFSGDVSGVPSFEGASMMVDGDLDASVTLMSNDARLAMANEPMGADQAMAAPSAPVAPMATPRTDRMAGTLSGQRADGMEAGPDEMALIYRNAAALTPTAVTAKDFLDGELVSADGEKLAEVKDVIIDQNGQARGVILATGGLFGLGRDYYAVDFDRVVAVRMDDGAAELQSALTEEDVERLREFDLEAFEADMGSLMLASELRDQMLPIGETDETVRVDDVIMSRSGAVEALVVDYDGDSFVAPFAELGVAQGDGGLFIDTTPELIGAMAIFEGRGAPAIDPAN